MHEENVEEQVQGNGDECPELVGQDDIVAIDEEGGLPESEHVPLAEALIFTSGEPLTVEKLGEILKVSIARVEEIVEEISDRCSQNGFGFELVKVGEAYQFRTLARYAGAIRQLKAGRPRRLSKPALETLAIVAYRQPIVKSDVEKLRGVDATPTLKTLLERRLVRIVGHQATVGQPALYGTTDEFLKLFGLASLSELPTLRDIKEMDEDPGENEESIDDASQELVSESEQIAQNLQNAEGRDSAPLVANQ